MNNDYNKSWEENKANLAKAIFKKAQYALIDENIKSDSDNKLVDDWVEAVLESDRLRWVECGFEELNGLRLDTISSEEIVSSTTNGEKVFSHIYLYGQDNNDMSHAIEVKIAENGKGFYFSHIRSEYKD